MSGDSRFALAGNAGAGDFIYFDGFESVTHPVAGALIVSEIMSNPTAVTDDQGEWFELTNVSAQTVDVGGCGVDNGGAPSLLPSHAFGAGTMAVVARNTSIATNGNVSAFAVFTFALAATGSIELTCDGRVIDSVSWPAESAGHSRNLDPRHFDAVQNDDPLNWCFSTMLYNALDAGSPNSGNETCP